MDQLHSTNDLGIGNRTTLQYNRLDQPNVQLLMLLQIGWELSAEVEYQNRLISLKDAIVKENDMREVKDFGSSIRSMIADMKASMNNAHEGFKSEFNNAQVNTSKVVSLTAELKSANQEVEDFLGETGSNFPQAGDGSSNLDPTSVKPDNVNGVIMSGTKK